MLMIHLSRRFDALDERRADDDPSKEQTQDELPAGIAHVFQAIRKRATQSFRAGINQKQNRRWNFKAF